MNVGYWRTGMRDREILTAILAQQPEEWRAWLDYHADMLYRVVLCAMSNDQIIGQGSPLDDDRRAAQVAMAALRYLAAPPEEQRITVKRAHWQYHEAQWINAIQREVAERQA